MTPRLVFILFTLITQIVSAQGVTPDRGLVAKYKIRKMTQYSSWNPSGKKDTNTYKFDEHGNIVSRTAGAQGTYTIRLHYDGKGQLEYGVEFDGTGVKTDSVHYTYKPDGEYTEYRYRLNKPFQRYGTPDFTSTKFNNKGKAISVWESSIQMLTYKFYDEHGELVMDSSTFANSKTRYMNEYDVKGRLIKRSWQSAQQGFLNSEAFQYDNRGFVTKYRKDYYPKYGKDKHLIIEEEYRFE